jgi:uncharacterized protein YkwD
LKLYVAGLVGLTVVLFSSSCVNRLKPSGTSPAESSALPANSASLPDPVTEVPSEEDPGAEDSDSPAGDDKKQDSKEETGTCYKADEFICQVELAITEQTNEVRGSLPPLKYSKSLSFVSREWSEEQARRGNIGHQGFPNQRVQAFRQEFQGKRVSMGAENVAFTFARSSSPEDVARVLTQMWARSPGHRRNMLGNFQQLGIGVVRDGNRFYGTQIFGRADD